ncbi:MAG: epimerase, partial [Solirubrobacterales bacterium]
MRVLVTGASGLIGNALCDALFARGDDVVGLTRNPGRARRSNPRVTWHKWEPTLERPDPAAFEGVDGVVNLIGERIDQRWTDEAKRKIMESRRQGTHNLVQAIGALPEDRRPKVLVSQSAVGYYGDRGSEEVEESDGPGSSFDSEVTQAWEAAAHEVEGADVRLAIVRTGQVLSPQGGMLKELLPPFRLGVGGPLAGGKQYVA